MKQRTILSHQEQVDLAIRAAQGDLDARNQMVLANLGLVGWVARRYLHQGLPFEDLYQEGVLGLIRATQDFDPYRGVQFSTYAKWWVANSMSNAIKDRSRTIRIPQWMSTPLKRFYRTRKVLRNESQRKPQFHEVADCMEIFDKGRRHDRRNLADAVRADQMKAFNPFDGSLYYLQGNP